jgi:hypothetical protein
MSIYVNRNIANQGLFVATNPVFRFGTGDFTIEFFLKIDGASWNFMRSFSFGTFSSASLGFNIAGNKDVSSGLQVWLTPDGQAKINVNPIVPYVDFTEWHHIAISRQSSLLRCFIDGVFMGSNTVAYNFQDSTNPLYIGGELNDQRTTGWITNFRFVTGIALYTAPFTVPNSPLTAVPGTQLLLQFSSSNTMLQDSSPNNLTVVNSNATLWSSESPFQLVDTPIIEFYPLVESQKITYWWTLPNPTNVSSVSIISGGNIQTYTNRGRQAVFQGLTNGILYSTTITATNDAGFSGDPVSFESVKPGVAPSEPLNVVISKSGDSVVVSWDPPASDGGSDIIWYALQSTDLAYTFSIEPYKRTFTSTSIANGTYIFVVYAINYVDWGAPSAGTSLTFP